MENIVASQKENATKLFKFLGACEYEDDKIEEKRNNLIEFNLHDFNTNSEIKEIDIKDMPIRLKKGGIRFRQDLNQYECRFMLNRQRKYFYDKSKANCIKKANQFYTKMIKGIKFEVKDNKLFFNMLDFWIENYKKETVSKSTYNSFKNIFNNYIKKGLKDKPIENITILEIDNYINSLPNTRTKEMIYTTLNEFFKFLFEKDLIKKQIHGRFKKYKHKREEGNFLTKEQRIVFLNSIEKIELKDFYKFIYYTGVRKHGALNLCYEDIDFKNKKIHIRETKTKESDRFIPLNKNIINLFNPTRKGKVFNISDRQIKNSLNEIEELCGFRVLIKDLRTTFATICREKGINDEIIAKWLGHTTTNTTRKYYIKVDTEYEREQADLL